MSGFSEANIFNIVQNCTERRDELAQALGQYLGRPCRIDVGACGTWQPESVPAELTRPGQILAWEIDGQGMLGLVPMTLAMTAAPTGGVGSDQERFDALARDWSRCILAEQAPLVRSTSLTVESLEAEVLAAQPEEWAALLELLISEPDDATHTPQERVFLVWPVLSPPVSAADRRITDSSRAATATTNASRPRFHRMERLRHLPVEISVRLAEKKIELGQLLSLTPGSLITFTKSCEDLLDLYVSNTLYCRGEAVKIGEKFGLKINELGVPPAREERIVGA